jgi:hypothetical protein
MACIDTEIKKYNNPRQNNMPDTDSDVQDNIPLYYENQMTEAYKVDERVLNNIVNRNVRRAEGNGKLKLIIY